MNKPKKTKVDAPHLLTVRLVLRGSSLELPSAPNPAPPKHSRAVKASTLAKKKLKQAQVHLRGARRFERLLRKECNYDFARLEALADFCIYLARKRRPRLAANRAVLEQERVNAMEEYRALEEEHFKLIAELEDACNDTAFWESFVPYSKCEALECEVRELRAAARARKR